MITVAHIVADILLLVVVFVYERRIVELEERITNVEHYTEKLKRYVSCLVNKPKNI